MSTPQSILAELWAAGIELQLVGDGANLSAPAGRLSAEQRALVVVHKRELIASIQAARARTAELLAAAMRTCDHHGDSDEARRQMRADCLATPPHLRADLLAYFRQTYGENPC